MYTYPFLIVFICESTAFLSEDLNVGTVLFSPSDIRKNRWNAKELGLLRARRQFQTLLPPPHTMNSDEDFINSMLDYFQACYLSVKSEAQDDEADNILKLALSDTIGGYLKAWLLPITKFAYYGGTVPQKDAVKLFEFYEKIKNNLNTNGRAWRSPNVNLLNSIYINIVPLRPLKPKRADDPCKTIAYFEKTDTGFAIPIPRVNWKKNSASMFVPLRNQSLIFLGSPEKNSLFKYYDAAKDCIGANKLEDQIKFENRFQDWLNREVVPHLNDEQLYPALGSVLTLVNKTRDLVDTVIELYTEQTPVHKHNISTIFGGFAKSFSSKKMMVIFLIIVLELAWCIPTLCYLLFVRMRRKKIKNVYLYVKKGQHKRGEGNNNTKCYTETTQYTPTQLNSVGTSCPIFSDSPRGSTTQLLSISSPEKPSFRKQIKERILESCGKIKGIYLSKNSQIQTCNIETRFSTTSSVLSLGYETQVQCSSMTVHERPIHPRHNISKKNINDIQIQNSSNNECNCVPGVCNMDKKDSYTILQEFAPTKTYIAFEESNNVTKMHKHNKKTQKSDEADTINSNAYKINIPCNPCTRKQQYKHINSLSKTVVPAQDHNRKTIRLKNQIDTSSGKNQRGIKVYAGKPNLEVTIERSKQVSERPKPSIRQTDTNAKTRQSKIPKRATTSFNNEAKSVTRSLATKNTQILSLAGKSFIPQPSVKKTVDDIIIHTQKTTLQVKKLNDTL